MNITRKKLTDLRKPEKNVRMHSTKQLSEFRRSIEMFGQIRPIVVDESGVILAGNGLYDALVSMNYEEADCYIVRNLSDKEKKKLMLADNRVFSLGVDDIAAFDEIIAELGNDLDIPGYDEELLQSLVADMGDLDDMIGGYGLINEQDKAGMAKASERYEAEERTFAEESEEVKPQTASGTSPVAPPSAHSSTDEVTIAPTPSPQEKPHVPLERKFVVCPKCGEKIWL